MAKFDLKAYARQGASSRVAELNAELAAIYGCYPSYGAERRKDRLQELLRESVSVVE